PKKIDKPDVTASSKLDEEGQRMLASINRTINYAEQEDNPHNGENMLDNARTQLAKDEVKSKLGAATIKQLQDRIDADAAKFAAMNNSAEAKRLVEYMESA